MQNHTQKILVARSRSAVGRPDTYLVLRRPFAHLEEELRRIADVTVIVDRRERDRRDASARIHDEQRRAERRSRRDELGELVIVSDRF
ncbi:MAG TPA: hypothetical protein VGF24_06300 [Vicinamibacterales bacterium]